MTEPKRKIPVTVICGPTACGKTAAAIELAVKSGAEIVSADSMQIYKGLDIGTAKPTAAELAAVPHHLVGFLDPQARYSVADYVEDAARVIADIDSRGKKVVVAGGTGLYISSLINGISFDGVAYDEKIREELYKRLDTEGIDALYNELCRSDPEYAAKTHKNNVKRVLRGLEICLSTGTTATEQAQKAKPAEGPYEAQVIFLDYADRGLLYAAIDRRVERMVQMGVASEAQYVYENRAEFITAAQAIGYKEFFPYIEGRQTLRECTEELKKATRHYAKRQLSWFRAAGCDRHVYLDRNN